MNKKYFLAATIIVMWRFIMSNLTGIILENPSDEHIKVLLSNLAYENLSTGFNFSNLDIVKQ